MSEQATSTSPGQQNDQSAEYGRYYYRHDCGIPYERNEHWLGFFGKIADGIVRDLRPASVLDAGCAMGFLVDALRARGVDAWGIDVSDYAISQVGESVREYCSVASLADPIPRRYDLIVSIEVLEHIPPTEANTVIANLCAATDRLLLSTTPDDYTEATHHNVQPPEAWSAMLAAEGFMRDVERDFTFVTPWAALYVRQDEPVSETVRRYDRSWVRQRREADQLRDSLLAAQKRFAELEDQPGGSRPELMAELDRRNEEILRLRDLLIGMEAELGSARGRVTELEERSRRLTSAKSRIESRIPFFRRLVGPVLRLLRGRG
ncbi:MAG: methyltransferase domain-containing protein [Solirubrobacterales bacterium]